MNNYSRNYLRVKDSRRGHDGRNPYGSKGGYVDSRSRDYRDRADMRYDRNYQEDMRSGNDYRDRNDYAEYDSRQDYRDYAEYDMQRDYGDYEQHRQYDMADMRRSQYRPVEAMGYFSGYAGGKDYGYDGHNKLAKKDIKKWEKSLENADGTKGKKYDVEQVEQTAKQVGVRFDEYSPESFTMVVNMMYADYCKVLGSDMMIYIKLAKAFLEDDDFDGEPEEKLMLYYKCIVEKDD